jgi:hypothetical protein
MCPITKKKLYYLLKHPGVKYDELFKLESLEFKSSIDLEEFSEEEDHFIKNTFLRYLPHDTDDLEKISGLR